MWERLKEIEARYEELEAKIGDPAVIARRDQWQQLVKEHAGLEEIVSQFRAYRKVQEELEEARSLLREKLEADFRAMVEGEIRDLESRRESLRERLKVLLLPRDPMDEKNVIVEVRAGAGGEEAALFAASLMRMYARYGERKGWQTEVMNAHATELGGFKEVVFAVQGKGAFSRLKYESGVHRVQRVPITESSGRIHTSTATVAVLPEAEEVEVHIDPDDLVIETFRASGPGGQHVNKTESAVRITHVPSGLVVSCQDEKSQHKNRDKAMRVLRSRLLQMAREEKQREVAEMRRAQVGSGERSERIRTYNFPQGRVTDHRIGLTVHRLEQVLDGDLDELIDTLAASVQQEMLAGAEHTGS